MQPNRPDATLSAEELDRLQAAAERIGQALAQAAAPGWLRLDLQARATLEHHEMVTHAVRPDGTIQRGAATAEVTAAVLELRHLMSAPECGAWLSVRLTVDPPDQLQLNVNYNDDPLWSDPPPAGAYHRDLQAFPRPPALVSGWLRARLDEPA